jgi:hypothetical protein
MPFEKILVAKLDDRSGIGAFEKKRRGLPRKSTEARWQRWNTPALRSMCKSWRTWNKPRGETQNAMTADQSIRKNHGRRSMQEVLLMLGKRVRYEREQRGMSRRLC